MDEEHGVYDVFEQGAAAPCSIAGADFLDKLKESNHPLPPHKR